MSKDDGQTDAPIKDEKHVRNLITAIKGSRLAEAWWAFKIGGLEGSSTPTDEEQAMKTNLSATDE